MQMYYKDELKEEVDDRISKANVPSKKRIGALRREMNSIYKDAPADVKAKVKASVASAKATMAAQPLQATPSSSPPPSELQK